jgi:hypothetical protein
MLIEMYERRHGSFPWPCSRRVINLWHQVVVWYLSSRPTNSLIEYSNPLLKETCYEILSDGSIVNICAGKGKERRRDREDGIEQRLNVNANFAVSYGHSYSPRP